MLWNGIDIPSALFHVRASMNAQISLTHPLLSFTWSPPSLSLWCQEVWSEIKQIHSTGLSVHACFVSTRRVSSVVLLLSSSELFYVQYVWCWKSKRDKCIKQMRNGAKNKNSRLSNISLMKPARTDCILVRHVLTKLIMLCETLTLQYIKET